MGVDAKLYLPADIDPTRVSDALAIAMGAKKVRTEFGVEVFQTRSVPESSFRLKCRVPDIPQMAHIGPYSFHWNCHIRSVKNRKKFTTNFGNCMIARSNATTISIFRKLARTFGGLLVPQDHDPDTYEEYTRPRVTKDDLGLQPDDEPYWDPFQDHIFKIKPVTARDLVQANAVSYYQWENIGELRGWAWKVLKKGGM